MKTGADLFCACGGRLTFVLDDGGFGRLRCGKCSRSSGYSRNRGEAVEAFLRAYKHDVRRKPVTGTGVRLIAAERKRQVEEEGWSPQDDAGMWPGGELAKAAAAYALPEGVRYMQAVKIVNSRPVYRRTLLAELWGMELSWWKPSPGSRIRELEKAGALIAAEIDRLLIQEGGE